MIIHTVSDTGPVWTFRLKQRGGSFDLMAPGAAVEARVKLSDDSLTAQAGVITDAQNGEFSVTWSGVDLAVAGLAKLELVYTATGGVVQHSREPIDVWIRPEYVEAETP